MTDPAAENAELKHDLSRQMAIAFEYVNKLAALEAENARLREALHDIANFGRNNPGYGYSCGTKARTALGEQP